MNHATRALCILGFLFASFAHADEPTVKYRELIGKQETIDISAIEFKGIVDGKNNISHFNPTTIRLHIKGMSACGKQFLVDRRDGVLSFYQVGGLGPHIQPGCSETIEFYWTPGNYDMADGETKVLSQKFGPAQRRSPTGGQSDDHHFVVSVKATKRSGQFPNGQGFGLYFEYDDVTVTQE